MKWAFQMDTTVLCNTQMRELDDMPEPIPHAEIALECRLALI
jgi:hypothetical protein